MINNRNGRRKFLKNSLLGAAGIAASSLMSACSTFDDYLFDDKREFNDEVIIIGGGIAGLYLAYKLRQATTEFRLFEGSSYLGGRVKSFSGYDYGASLISNKNTEAKKIIEDFGLETHVLNKENFFLLEGMQSLTDTLFDRTVGLIPYRSFRLRSKLVEIQKFSSGYDLIFQFSGLQRRYSCKKVALAIPPTQWGSVRGLFDLPEMGWAKEWVKGIQVENTIKIILPSNAISSISNPFQIFNVNDIELRQIVKMNKTLPTVEIDIRHPEDLDLGLEDISNLLKNKLGVSFPLQKIAVEQYFDWSQVELIRGSSFKNDIPMPEVSSNNFQIVGDFASKQAQYSIEGALLSAKKASRLLL